MRLKIADKWKWIARDSDGDIIIFAYRPRPSGRYWGMVLGSSLTCPDIFSAIELGEWRDSLHEILPDGTLRKYVERPDLIEKPEICDFCRIKELYFELLHEVHQKVPEENRQQTALRYLRERRAADQNSPPKTGGPK